MKLKINKLKSITTVVLFTLTSFLSLAQEVFYKEMTKGNEKFKIELSDIVAEGTFLKLKVTVINNTDDYLHFDASKTIFTLGDKTYSPEKRLIDFSSTEIVKPFGSRSRVLNISGASGFNPKEFKIKFNGISFVSIEGDVVAAENYKLPPARRAFKVGAFEIELSKLKQKTDETAAKFKIVYKGNKIGILDPNKAVVKIESGEEFINLVNGDPIMIQKGGDASIEVAVEISPRILDMQYSTLWIVWKNTFRETVTVPSESIEFVVPAK